MCIRDSANNRLKWATIYTVCSTQSLSQSLCHNFDQGSILIIETEFDWVKKLLPIFNRDCWNEFKQIHATISWLFVKITASWINGHPACCKQIFQIPCLSPKTNKNWAKPSQRIPFEWQNTGTTSLAFVLRWLGISEARVNLKANSKWQRLQLPSAQSPAARFSKNEYETQAQN